MEGAVIFSVIFALIFGVSVGWILGKSSHEKSLEDSFKQGIETERVRQYELWRDGKWRFAKREK